MVVARASTVVYRCHFDLDKAEFKWAQSHGVKYRVGNWTSIIIRVLCSCGNIQAVIISVYCRTC